MSHKLWHNYDSLIQIYEGDSCLVISFFTYVNIYVWIHVFIPSAPFVQFGSRLHYIINCNVELWSCRNYFYSFCWTSTRTTGFKIFKTDICLKYINIGLSDNMFNIDGACIYKIFTRLDNVVYISCIINIRFGCSLASIRSSSYACRNCTR